jgi:aminomethyltransferase
MRAHTIIYASEEAADPIGEVTSGAFGPTLNAPMSMAYVTTEFAASGTRLFGDVRGKRMPVQVVDLPFVPNNFKR